MSIIKHQMTWPIPDDWDEEQGECVLFLVCVPNSQQWRGIFTGLVADLFYGRRWDRSTGTITEATRIGHDIFEGMCYMKCDDLLEVMADIRGELSAIAQKMELFSQTIGPPANQGNIPVGPGEQFPDAASYFSAKCNVSNAIYDTILAQSTWLRDNNVDLLAGALGGVTTGLFAGLVAAGPVGWAIGVGAGALGLIGTFVIQYAISFSDLTTAISQVQSEAVLGMYNADKGNAAREAFLSAVDGATQSITATERLLLSYLLADELMNQLFTPRSDLVQYQSPSPVDCGSAILQIWTFPTDQESWTYTDTSDPSCSATMAYDSPNEALKDTLVVASLPNVTAQVENNSPTISQVVTPGASMQIDYSAVPDAPFETRITGFVNYSDATSENATVVFGSAGTLIVPITQSKTVTSVRVQVARSTGASAAGTTHSIYIYEVRIIGV